MNYFDPIVLSAPLQTHLDPPHQKLPKVPAGPVSEVKLLYLQSTASACFTVSSSTAALVLSSLLKENITSSSIIRLLQKSSFVIGKDEMSDSATEKVLREKLEVNLAASKVDSAVANFHTTLANER